MDRQTLASSSSSSSSSSQVPSPDAWITTYKTLLPQWNSFPLSQQIIPITISRVNQFDAARLDVEMSAMLKEQLVKVFSLMKGEKANALTAMMLRSSVDKLTDSCILFKFANQHIVKYLSENWLGGSWAYGCSKLWYCIATVGGQYIWTRLQSFSAFRRWGDSEQRTLGQRAWLLLQHIEGIYKAATFSNLLIFLLTGKYRSLIERFLRARLVYGGPNMNRSVSFEYMNRQLVWNEFSEMLLLLLPLLNSSSLKNLFRPFSKDKSSDSATDEISCPICQGSPSIPFLALPCRHRYCYYCLRTRCAASPSFRCTRCSQPVTAMQRLGSSVDENSAKK